MDCYNIFFTIAPMISCITYGLCICLFSAWKILCGSFNYDRNKPRLNKCDANIWLTYQPLR